jgi:predicted RNA-binding protein with TRAM domain
MHSRYEYLLCAAAAALALLCAADGARADITITSGATTNMSCSDGFCEPTAAKAVLNAGDLENYLATFGNVTVQTTGEGGVESNNIVVETAFASPGGSFLNLFAQVAIAIDAHVTIGSGGQISGLELVSDAAGELLGAISCGPKGRISFDSTSDQFNINGAVAVLVDTLPGLAAAVNSNPEGFYVLANDYDAGKDGTYHSSPIGATFTGYFEALGNTILHVKVVGHRDGVVGVFSEINGGAGFGVVRNLRLAEVSIDGRGAGNVGGVAGQLTSGATVLQSSVTGKVKGAPGAASVGGLAGFVQGSIVSSWSAANVSATGAYIGGLAGAAETIIDSYPTGRVSDTASGDVGGLVGANISSVAESFALGEVTSGGNGAEVGGLIGVNVGSVKNSYAAGDVAETKGGNASDVGGLIGYDESIVTSSYSTGLVSGEGADLVGGVVGDDDSDGGFSDTYWDTTTSGVSQGAGNITNDPGITGLTSKQLRSGLPDGFAKSFWKEKGSINSGFPYLIANPPPK